MKRIMSLIAVALLLAILLTACSKPADDVSSVSQAELTIDGVEWIVEPTLEYEYLYYNPFGDCFTDGEWILDEYTGKPVEKAGGGGGVTTRHFYYDKEKGIVGCVEYDHGNEHYETCLTEEFAAHFSYYNYSLNLFTEYDSTKVIVEDEEIGRYNFDNASIGKDAVALGANILTEFEFEGGENGPLRKSNNIISVKKDGKWGVVDIHGKVVAPFVFEEALSINNWSAFAKYNGKWGIIKVK